MILKNQRGKHTDAEMATSTNIPKAASCQFGHKRCRKVKRESESEVAQLCLTLRDLMDCSLPGSSVHGIFQAKVLEWGAIAFSGDGVMTFFFFNINLFILIGG